MITVTLAQTREGATLIEEGFFVTANTDVYDVIIVGSGGGGLVGAFTAAARGLRTLVIEKTDVVGGTTAYSGAGLWFPGSAPITRAGGDDDIEEARTYLRSVVDDPSRELLQDAYLRAGIELIEELERNKWFQSFTHGPVPDYYPYKPGASPTGSTIFPPDVDVADLGEYAALVRRSIPEERWGRSEGPVFHGGRALVARALAAFLECESSTLWLNTALESLVVEDSRVVGLRVVKDGEERTVRAKYGVVLAAGGFERNAELRAKHQPIPLTGEWSNGSPANTGDALLAGIAIGAATDLLDEAWYVPGTVQPDGLPVFQSGMRGGIWVNAAGERFMNEVGPYDQSGHEIARLHETSGVSHIPTHWILDQRQIDRDGFGGPPDEPIDPEWFASGALRKASSVQDLAEMIGVPLDALAATIDEFNGFAKTGLDEKYHRGETPWDDIFNYVVPYPFVPELNYAATAGPVPGFPNQLLLPLDTPPFYVATIVLSDIGTKGGLKIDENARVLRADDSPIAGLYATGNTAAAMSGRTYPGAGTPIGSSVAFAYLAVRHITETTPASNMT